MPFSSNANYHQHQSSPSLPYDCYTQRDNGSSHHQHEYSWDGIDFTTTSMISNPGPADLSYRNKNAPAFVPHPQFSQSSHPRSPPSSSMSDANSTISLFPSSEQMDFNPYLTPNQVQLPPQIQSQNNSTNFVHRSDSNSSFPSYFSPHPKQIHPLIDDRMGPLMTSNTEGCQPHRCGHNPPCTHFVNTPGVEDSASMSSTTPIEVVYPIDTATAPADITRPISSTNSDHSQRSSSKPTSLRGLRTVSYEDTRETKQRAKNAHSLVERKYRENLNAKFVQLHTVLKESHCGPRMTDDVIGDETLMNNSKLRKGDVLADAVRYINHTEVEIRHMAAEINSLRDRVHQLERLLQGDNRLMTKGMPGYQMSPV